MTRKSSVGLTTKPSRFGILQLDTACARCGMWTLSIDQAFSRNASLHVLVGDMTRPFCAFVSTRLGSFRVHVIRPSRYSLRSQRLLRFSADRSSRSRSGRSRALVCAPCKVTRTRSRVSSSTRSAWWRGRSTARSSSGTWRAESAARRSTGGCLKVTLTSSGPNFFKHSTVNATKPTMPYFEFWSGNRIGQFLNWHFVNVLQVFASWQVAHREWFGRQNNKGKWTHSYINKPGSLSSFQLIWCELIFQQVWSLETGERLSTLQGHRDGVTCLQFSDSIIVSGSYDTTVRLWNFASVWRRHFRCFSWPFRVLIPQVTTTRYWGFIPWIMLRRHCWYWAVRSTLQYDTGFAALW